MATGTKTRESLGQRRFVQRYVATSAANTAQTVSTDGGGAERIIFVSVVYSSAVTQTVTITVNAVAGAAYDCQLESIALASNTDGAWIPDHDVWMMAGDALDVVAPAGGSGVTSAVMIYTEAM